MNVLQAVIYVRVSNDQNSGRSVQDQERECRTECERKGWPVRAVFSDNDIGASRFSAKQRPQWAELKASLRPGDIVVMWEASRSTRDLAEFVALRTLCADLGVPLSYGGRQLDMSEAEDRFVGGLDALLAEREAEQIRSRVLRGKRASAADGRPYGKPPWGLRRADTVELKWELDPVEAPRLREAMDRVLAGNSFRSVLTWLRSTGRAPVDVTGLRRALCNPAVAGLRVHQARSGNTSTFPADWPAIVSPDEQARVTAHGKRNPESRGRTPVHLLSGIAKCGVCGTGLEHKQRKGREDNYRCPNGHVTRNANLLDGMALAQLVLGYAGEQPPADDLKARRAKADIAAIEDELAAYEERAIAGDITAAAFARIEKGLLARIEALRPDTVQAIAKPYEHLRISTKSFLAASVAEQRDMLRSRLSVTVNPVPAGRRARAEDALVTPR